MDTHEIPSNTALLYDSDSLETVGAVLYGNTEIAPIELNMTETPHYLYHVKAQIIRSNPEIICSIGIPIMNDTIRTSLKCPDTA